MTDYLTVAEAAELYGISESRVKKWLKHGKIRGRKHAGVWLIEPDQARPITKPGRPPNDSKQTV